MDFHLFFKGVLASVIINAPIGPIGILCIRHSFTKGSVFGFLSGLGVVTADLIYGGIAVFGLTFVSNLFISQQTWIRLIGGIFLCCLGMKLLISKTAEVNSSMKGNALWGAYFSMFFLTLSNPMAFFSVAAIFASLGVVGENEHFRSAWIPIFGLFLGSTLWWLLLSAGISLFRLNLNPQRLQWINRISAILIIAFGLTVLLSLGVRN